MAEKFPFVRLAAVKDKLRRGCVLSCYLVLLCSFFSAAKIEAEIIAGEESASIVSGFEDRLLDF